jgi:hypothetical protein
MSTPMNEPTPNEGTRSFQYGVTPLQEIELKLIPWPEGVPPPPRIGRPTPVSSQDDLDTQLQEFPKKESR